MISKGQVKKNINQKLETVCLNILNFPYVLHLFNTVQFDENTVK